MRCFRLWSLALLVVIQLSVPLSRMIVWDDVLHNGERFRFQAAPIDPYDAFRGRYLAVSVAESSVDLPSAAQILSYKDKVYALISQDDKGLAILSGLSLKRPLAGDYIEARVLDTYKGKADLALPIDRYYMQEKMARAADAAYMNALTEGLEATLLVRVKDGRAVIEAVMIKDQTIEQYIREGKRVRP